jgi:hypothetical protein
MSRYIVAAITFLLAFAVGAFLFIMLLVAMNGLHGSDARYGVIAYIVLSFIVTLLLTLLAFVATGKAVAHGKSPVISGIVIVLVSLVLSTLSKLFIMLISIFIADFARVNF